jgi:hypothetical protein
METLAPRAALLRDSLDKSQQVTDAVVSILGSFDSRLSALDSAMRPIQVRTRSPPTLLRCHYYLLLHSPDRFAAGADARGTHGAREHRPDPALRGCHPHSLRSNQRGARFKLTSTSATWWFQSLSNYEERLFLALFFRTKGFIITQSLHETAVPCVLGSRLNFKKILSLQAEREIQKGPHENLQGFLDAVDRLRSIERFFSSNRSYRSSDGVLNNVNALLSKALVKMEDEFQKQLSQRRLASQHHFVTPYKDHWLQQTYGA